MKTTIILFLFGSLLALFFIFCNESIDKKGIRGLELAKEKCFKCHAPTKSNIGPSFEGLFAEHKNKDLKKKIIKEFDCSKSSNFGNHKDLCLSKKEVDDLISYLRILSGELLSY